MNPSLNLPLPDRPDVHARKKSEFNTSRSNQTVVNWSPIEHFVNGVTVGSVWVEGQPILYTDGRGILRGAGLRVENRCACLSSSVSLSLTWITLSESDGGESGDDQPSTAGTPDRTPRRNEEQRRQFLENDPRALILRDGEVQCRACQKWIKLGAQRRYDLSAWNQHCGRCTGELYV